MKKDLFNKTILIFSIFGIILSSWMWWFKLENEIPPCTLSGCEQVLTGEYSVMFGVPVAAFGFFYYVSLSVLAFQSIFVKHRLLKWMLGLDILVGIIFTVYLRYLEFAKIGDWCQWCWLSVLFIIVITASFIINIKSSLKAKKK